MLTYRMVFYYFTFLFFMFFILIFNFKTGFLLSNLDIWQIRILNRFINIYNIMMYISILNRK
jgi:hypothetical protein